MRLALHTMGMAIDGERTKSEAGTVYQSLVESLIMSFIVAFDIHSKESNDFKRVLTFRSVVRSALSPVPQ